jgi:ketosteroid isomerase-like protein
MKLILPMVLVVTTLAVIASPQEKKPQAELASLVEAERSFSRTCVAKGLRAAFQEFFADDGIRFLPHPVKAQENFRQRPAPAGPQSFTLSWEPVFADISQAGDLGYTTGPYVVTDNAKKNPPGYGYYFSIWRKQTDGSWKVLLDYGTDVPAPANPDNPPPFKPASGTGWKRNAAQAGLDDSTVLANLDRETSVLSASQGITATYRQLLLSDARLHRAGLMPLVDPSSILSFLDEQHWIKDAPGVLEKGYYARVWKRDGKGNWKIAMDVANALPPEPAPKP